jgi:hypothetical protein
MKIAGCSTSRPRLPSWCGVVVEKLLVAAVLMKVRLMVRHAEQAQQAHNQKSSLDLKQGLKCHSHYYQGCPSVGQKPCGAVMMPAASISSTLSVSISPSVSHCVYLSASKALEQMVVTCLPGPNWDPASTWVSCCSCHKVEHPPLHCSHLSHPFLIKENRDSLWGHDG